MEKCLGKNYVVQESENYDEYLKFLGLGLFPRTVAKSLKPVHCLTKNSDNTYTFTFKSAVASASCTFTPGDDFEELKPDGVTVTSQVTIEGNIMIHIQKEDNGRVTKHKREFFPDHMISVTSADGFDKLLIRRYVVEK